MTPGEFAGLVVASFFKYSPAECEDVTIAVRITRRVIEINVRFDGAGAGMRTQCNEIADAVDPGQLAVLIGMQFAAKLYEYRTERDAAPPQRLVMCRKCQSRIVAVGSLCPLCGAVVR